MDNIPISKMTDGQKRALQLMLNGANVFLTGEAGTGKSEVVKTFIRMAEEDGKNLLITAPTGTAADNLHGETIHRCFDAKIGVQKNSRTLTERKDVLKVADILIIDEISMCRFDLFEYVARRIVFENEERARDRMKKSVGYLDDAEVKEHDLQVIVLGDFYQLPPVITDDDRVELSSIYKFDFGKGYAFMSPYWKMLGFEGIVLTEIIRQEDAAFKQILSEIRQANQNSKNTCIDFLMRNSSGFLMTDDESIFLVPTNKKCNELNSKKLRELSTKSGTYYSKVDGDVNTSDKFAEDEILLKEGCKVMMTVNDSSRKFVNGSMGIVKKLRNETVDILLEDGTLVTVGDTTKEITKPVVKEKKVKRLMKEATIDEDGQPKVDSNGDVIMHEVLREVKEEEIVHEKVGTFSQIPVRVAYAITIHKSQGKTFSKINLDPYAWDDGQFYTALSRGRKLENIFFMENIRPSFIKTSAEVKRFMKDIQKSSRGLIEV